MLLYINWNVNPEAFHIGFLSIKWYGLLWGTGLMSTFFLGSYILKTLGRDEEMLTILIQYIFVFGLIGARLAQVFFYEWDYFSSHPEKIIAVWEGGLASHGGVLGGLLGLLIFCRRNSDYPLFWTIDHAAIVVLLLAALIRLGNLMNSEIVGKATEVPWAFVFQSYDSVPRHPVVLYESIAYFFIQLLQLYLFRKYRDTRPGIYLVVFFLLVFSVRFLLEFFKVPEGRLFFGVISKTQMLNVPFILTGIVFLVLVMRKQLRYKLSPHGRL